MTVKTLIIAEIVLAAVVGAFFLGGAMLNSPRCPDGARPDKNGCCAGEVYTDMGDQGFNCCPDAGDCFPPIK